MKNVFIHISSKLIQFSGKQNTSEENGNVVVLPSFRLCQYKFHFQICFANILTVKLKDSEAELYTSCYMLSLASDCMGNH